MKVKIVFNSPTGDIFRTFNIRNIISITHDIFENNIIFLVRPIASDIIEILLDKHNIRYITDRLKESITVDSNIVKSIEYIHEN